MGTIAGYNDRLLLRKDPAWTSTVNGRTEAVGKMTDGDVLDITSGTGLVDVVGNGSKRIYSGGVGVITTLNSGWQDVSSGGMGTVVTMKSGI